MKGTDMKNLMCSISVFLILSVCHCSVLAQQKDGERGQPKSDIKEASTSSSQIADIVYKGSEVDKKAVIISRPEPAYTIKARKKGTAGKVRLRMVLTATGEVSDIKVLKSLTHGLTENAIEAARLIKFQPAMKDGREVSQYVTFEYNFGIIGQSLLGDEINKVYYQSDCADYSRVGGREKLIIFSSSKEAKQAGYREANTRCP